jgi:ribonuclease-3 family protein
MEENINDAWAVAIESLLDGFDVKAPDVKGYSPLALAYVGDTVFDLVFRTVVVSRHNMAANKYHNEVKNYVSAVAQSEMVEKMKEHFTEEEERVFLRGRNSKPYNKAKNASVIEYQRATGLECLVGYLYLKKDMKRVIELIHYAVDE